MFTRIIQSHLPSQPLLGFSSQARFLLGQKERLGTKLDSKIEYAFFFLAGNDFLKESQTTSRNMIFVKPYTCRGNVR